MNDHRFDFLEVSGQQPNAAGLSGRVMQPGEVPLEQQLAYYDLLALNPAKTVLKQISKKLLTKYQLIPFALLLRQVKVRVPQHFKVEFHTQWLCDSPFTLYIALCNPSDTHCLRLLHNATGYSIYAIPLRLDAFEQFMTLHYDRIIG